MTRAESRCSDQKGVRLTQRTTYDALIIGGRAAGGSLALLLAQRGYRVLVVDRDRFPSDTMSTHFMNPRVVPLLDQLGVLTSLEAAGFRRITRSRIYLVDCIFDASMPPMGSGYALAPRRDVLDSLLVQRATEYGAEFVERTRGESLIEEDGRIAGAILRHSNGERREIRAAVVVGADGKYSSVAKWVQAEEYAAMPALRPVYYAHFNGIEPLPEPTVEVFFGNDRMALLFPMRSGEDCLAVELQPDDFDRFRSDPQGQYDNLIRGLYGMSTRMRDAVIDGKLIGVRGIDNYFRKPFGPGWALVGDAGYLKDPSTGTGIGDALQQSIWLADALHDCFQGASWDERMAEFQQTRDRVMMPGYQSTIDFTQMRDPAVPQIAMVKAAMSSPLFARILVNALPGMIRHVYQPDTMTFVTKTAEAFLADGSRFMHELAQVD